MDSTICFKSNVLNNCLGRNPWPLKFIWMVFTATIPFTGCAEYALRDQICEWQFMSTFLSKPWSRARHRYQVSHSGCVVNGIPWFESCIFRLDLGLDKFCFKTVPGQNVVRTKFFVDILRFNNIFIDIFLVKPILPHYLPTRVLKMIKFPLEWYVPRLVAPNSSSTLSRCQVDKNAKIYGICNSKIGHGTFL